jgi:hypothetical protein
MISAEAEKRLSKGERGCAHHAGYSVEKKHCPCGVDYYIVKVQCDMSGREVRSNRCTSACPNYQKKEG